jgi:hypothetical protein
MTQSAAGKGAAHDATTSTDENGQLIRLSLEDEAKDAVERAERKVKKAKAALAAAEKSLAEAEKDLATQKKASS